MEHTLTPEMITVLAVMGLTIFLFVSEIVRVDVAAVLVMITLGLLGLVEADRLFDGFASNAVISIIAVMIIGAGLDRTGLMNKVAAFILRIGGRTEARLIPIISGTVGTISSFMQNVGAAALFLPVVQRISERTGIPPSRLLMPMGFTAILGGTMTLVGSSPLILLNDLILSANESLPPGTPPMATFDLFDVTPIGLALVITGIAYFVVAGRFVLPAKPVDSRPARTPLDFAGRTVEAVENEARGVHVVALRCEEIEVAPPRETVIEAGCDLAVIGHPEAVRRWVQGCRLELTDRLDVFAEVMDPSRSGIAEVVIGPRHLGASDPPGRRFRLRRRHRLPARGTAPAQGPLGPALLRPRPGPGVVHRPQALPGPAHRGHGHGDLARAHHGRGLPGGELDHRLPPRQPHPPGPGLRDLRGGRLDVPLAVNIAVQSGADPALFALIVALATSNSFLIPTHQVNALIMGPGGYRNADFLRAGGGMTVLFLVVLIAMVNLVF